MFFVCEYAQKVIRKTERNEKIYLILIPENIRVLKKVIMALKLTILSIIVFILNIPFGYWRSNVKKFSVYWFLAVHLPIPFIVLLRIYSNIGFVWFTYPALVGSFFIGQRYGSNLRSMVLRRCGQATSVIFNDLWRCFPYKSSK